MTPTLDPLAASDRIVAGYRRYLRSLLPLRDARLADALHTAIDSSPTLTKGPLLEATPAYAPGATLADLVREGVLGPNLLRFTGPALPADRPLHRHQEDAIRKARGGRNVVVATGTGSGKTESFLLPVLARLADEAAAGPLEPGVRALLLYPMNALANDQMKRLRGLLAGTPDVTFGRYTGETKQDRGRAEEDFARLHAGEPRLPNELLSRDEMRAAPPHLLLTNYAMLEYLLLRPQDMELFAGHSWRFVVVDEAHVYDGAKGAELAMLLRRLRDRVAPAAPLQAIATSATVGADRDPAAVTRFASDLFGLPFAWEAADATRQDLVTASVVETRAGAPWGPLPVGAYRDLHTGSASLPALAREHGWDGDGDAADALATEHRVLALREALRGGPRPVPDLARQVFPEQPDAVAAVGDLVRLAGSTGSPPVLSARFHLFARATEGAFSCLGAEPHLALARHEQCDRCPRVAFELGGCRRCGAVHLHGALDDATSGMRHVPYRAGVDRRHSWLLLDDSSSSSGDDEDDALDEDATAAAGATARLLCVGCGALHEPGTGTCNRASCPGSELRAVWQLDAHGADLGSCAACGGRSPRLIRLLESGGEAAASVLGSALYEELPADTTGAAADAPGEGRKLLFFSDSRQMAAYFAPYLQDTHERITHRRLITMALTSLAHEDPDEPLTVNDVVARTAKLAQRHRMFDEHTSKRQRDAAAGLWLTQELVAMDDRQSVEGVGLARFELPAKRTWPAPAALSALGLDDAECWDVLRELLRNLRSQGAVTMPEDVEHGDEAFSPRRGPIHVRGVGSEPKKKVLSWVPTTGTNGRRDYLARLLDALGSPADPTVVLGALWDELDPTRAGDGPHRWLSSETVARIGTVRRIDVRALRLGEVAVGEQLHRCDRCRRLAPVSVRGVCPTLRCTGRLRSWMRPDSATEDDHYRHLYTASRPVQLSVQEHTAQWTSEKAADIQASFVRGTINALSCSTTFELGVDVGDLQAVVLRNMPPTTANYVQRAGRAGRRTSSAALVLTYAQRRSHDLTRFAEPEKMIAGVMRPPFVPLENERIDRRHAHSVALAAFFRTMSQHLGLQWRTAGDFFLAPEPCPPGHVTGPQRLGRYLATVPAAVRRSLEAVLPEAVQKELDVAGDGWVHGLLQLVELAEQQLALDVAAFRAKQDEASAAENYAVAGRCKKIVQNLRGRDLLGYLANRNVLPKYGFPVDTVELRTDASSTEIGRSLELTRDLTMAISEYAPGAQVVAGGHRWTSGGVYRLPGKELVTRHYVACRACGHYREGVQPPDPTCPACHTVANRQADTYVEPAYGFVALAPLRQGAGQAPRRSWSGVTHIVETDADVQTGRLAFPLGEVTWRAGTRGRFVGVNEGTGRAGFLLCDWCGWGVSVTERRRAAHPHLLKGTGCSGPLQRHSLAHSYETDFVEVEFDALVTLTAGPALRSTVYALLEGASTALEISRDDIDGTVHHGGDSLPRLVLFDTTPGGAGNALRIAAHLPSVVDAAVARMQGCECGEETSCYGCLRAYRNERFHTELSRGAALDLLGTLRTVER